MQWFRNLPTMKKLFVGFGLMATLIGVVGYLGIQRVGTIHDLGREIKTHGEAATRLQAAVVQLIKLSRGLSIVVLDDDAASIEKRLTDAQKYEALFQEAFGIYQQTLIREDAKKRAAEALQMFRDMQEGAQKIYALAKTQKVEEAKTSLKALRATTDKLESALDELTKIKTEVVKQTNENAEAVYVSTRLFLAALVLIAAVLAMGLGYFIARLIAGPLGQAVTILEAVAAGDLAQHLVVTSRDDVGRMAGALNRAVDSMRAAMVAIGQNAQTLAGASEELTSVSQQMSANTEETAAQANVVSAASEQVSRNIQTVTASAEEMTASIKEIAKNAGEAARVTAQAVQVTESTNTTITKLGESSAEIGEVIKVITSIAEQTNLLALNATIEAARAGEAGKGFAVVANEVKELAKQTAEATENISHKIGAIQSDAQNAVAAIGQISGIINQINDIAGTIASAVEEQSVTTAEMGRNVEEAAKGGAEIAQNIGGVAQAAQSTASGATETQASAQELSRMAIELQQLVGQFKVETTGMRTPQRATSGKGATVPVGVRSYTNGRAHDTAQF
jgi:methyl-accepting chemotaxis protein